MVRPPIVVPVRRLRPRPAASRRGARTTAPGRSASWSGLAVWAVTAGTLAAGAAAPPASSARSAARPQAPVARAGAGGAAAAAVTDPTYAALRAARPDGRVAAVHGLLLDRVVFIFELESGAVPFLEPVAGRTTGGVSLGRGTLRLNPATAVERRQLALELGEGKDFEVLTDSFDELVLLFGDDTAQEIAAAAPIEKHAPDPRARQVYERWLERQRRDFHLNLQLRLLRDLLNARAPAAAAPAPAVVGPAPAAPPGARALPPPPPPPEPPPPPP